MKNYGNIKQLFQKLSLVDVKVEEMMMKYKVKSYTESPSKKIIYIFQSYRKIYKFYNYNINHPHYLSS